MSYKLPDNTFDLSVPSQSHLDWTLTVPTSNSAVKVPEADIKMGNVSLKDFIAKTNSSLSAIEDRLNILQINQQLEKDWKDLRELGQQYRQLEKEILDKIKVWDKLK